MKFRVQYLRNSILWGGIGLGALAFWPLPWMDFTLPKLLVLHIAVALSCLLFLFNYQSLRVRRLPFFLVMGYFSLLLIYTVFSLAPLSSFFGISESSQGFLTQLIYFAIFLLALQIDDEEKKAGFKIIFAVNVVIVFYALLQVFGLDPLMNIWNKEAFLGRVFSTLGHPDWLGVWLLLTFPLVLRLKRNRWLFMILQTFALFLTASKAALLGFGIFILGFVISQRKKFIRAWQKILIVFSVIFLAGGFLFFRFYPNLPSLLRSMEARRVIWSNSWKMMEARSFGYGLEVFPLVYPQFNTAELWHYEAFGTAINHPHNQFLELWLAIGPWGALLFYVLITVIIAPHVKNIVGENDLLLAWGVVSALVAQFFGFETVVTSALFWLFLGLLAQKNGRDFYIKKSWKAMIIVLMFFHFMAAGARWFQIEGHFGWDRTQILQESFSLLNKPSLSANELGETKKLLVRGAQLGNNQDPEIILLQALLVAHEGKNSEAQALYALGKNKNSVNPRTYYIGMKIFEILNQTSALEDARKTLCSLAPPYWNQSQTEQGRIFQKTNPWVVANCQ